MSPASGEEVRSAISIGARMRRAGRGGMRHKHLPYLIVTANIFLRQNWNAFLELNSIDFDRTGRRMQTPSCPERDPWNFCETFRVGKEKI